MYSCSTWMRIKLIYTTMNSKKRHATLWYFLKLIKEMWTWYNFSGSSNGLSLFFSILVWGDSCPASFFSLFFWAGLFGLRALTGLAFFVSYGTYSKQLQIDIVCVFFLRELNKSWIGVSDGWPLFLEYFTPWVQ